MELKLLSLILVVFLSINVYPQHIPNDEIRAIETMIKQIKTIYPDGTVAIDGILSKDVSQWFKSKDRIMFILKEPYDIENLVKGKSDYYNKWLNTSYNTIQAIPQEDGAPTFRPIATITNMIVQNLDYASIQQQYNNPEAYKIFLNCTAIINSKKEHNRNSIYTSEKELRVHITQYHTILEKQLKVYNPTVVIFGNTHKYLVENKGFNVTILGESIPPYNVKLLPDGKHKYYYNNKRIFIESYHPSARISKEKYCSQIWEAVKSWKQEYDKD